MVSKPLEALKKGLFILKKHTKARADNIRARLARKEKVSDADEQWLDNEANVVEEEMVIEKLENASRGWTREKMVL
jgi:hypothetical protein